MSTPSFFQFSPLSDSGDYSSAGFPQHLGHWLEEISRPSALRVPSGTLKALMIHVGMFKCFSQARPLFDAAVSAGETPWEKASERWDLSLYQMFVDDANDASVFPMLEWCWEQPGAPALEEASIVKQVRSHFLTTLLSKSYALGNHPLDVLEKHGFEATEVWANGATTFSRLVDAMVIFGKQDNNEYWRLKIVRDCRRLVKAAREKGLAEEAFDVATAGIHASVSGFGRFATFPDDAKNPLRASFKKLLEDFAPSHDRSVKAGAEALLRHYAATPCRSVWHAGAPPTMIMSLHHMGLLPASNIEGAVTMTRHGLEQLPPDEVLGFELKRRHQALGVLLSFWSHSPSGKPLAWEDPWDLALPKLLASESNAPSFPDIPTGFKDKGVDPNDWPDVPFWNRIVEGLAWSEDVSKKARARQLAHAWPEPEPRKRGPRF